MKSEDYKSEREGKRERKGREGRSSICKDDALLMRLNVENKGPDG